MKEYKSIPTTMKKDTAPTWWSWKEITLQEVWPPPRPEGRGFHV